MLLKTIEEQRAEAEAMVKGMNIIGSVRRLEHSQYVWACDDYDMDTTETLYQDANGAYYLRIEMYHDFMDDDSVYKVERAEAQKWIRENKRNAWAARRRSRQIIGLYGKHSYNFWKTVHKHFRKKAQKGVAK